MKGKELISEELLGSTPAVVFREDQKERLAKVKQPRYEA